MARLFVAAVFVAVLPALASEPGQPLDCSDIVFDVPGLNCRPFLPFGVSYDDHFYAKGHNQVFDNEGRLTVVRLSTNNPPLGDNRIAIYQNDGMGERRIASFPAQRFVPTSSYDRLRTRNDPDTFLGSNVTHDGVQFDPVNGRLLLPLVTECQGACPCGSGPCHGSGYGGRWMAVIEGFTTLYDIRQSYVPTSHEVGFRVPAMPDGLAGAHHFDTYWGNLANPIDFTQAQPLQCDYPASPPQVGDYLTVADALPNPVVGTGRYYVTAVTHQGQTRYGRKGNGGVLSGRDPALLPVCVQSPSIQE